MKDTSPEAVEIDNDGWTRTQVQDFFKEKYPELTELEMNILMGIHSKSPCGTGIWCESELTDWVNLFLAERSRIRAEVLEARIDELRLIIKETELFSKKRSHYVSQVYLKINYLTRRVDELHSELATLREQPQEKS